MNFERAHVGGHGKSWWEERRECYNYILIKKNKSSF